MSDPLDVLVLENRPGAAKFATATLEKAGHHVHRCHDVDCSAFPCRGIDKPGTCPLDHPVDVAVVVRHGVTPRPTYYEHGVLCAIQRGLPIVEAGRDILDPFGPWVTERRDDDSDLESACYSAVVKGFAPLRSAVKDRLAPVLNEHDIEPDAVECVVERRDSALMVSVLVDRPIDARVEQALAVRAFDAIRADRRHFDEVDVQVIDSPSR
jgi:hypothetical protein